MLLMRYEVCCSTCFDRCTVCVCMYWVLPDALCVCVCVFVSCLGVMFGMTIQVMCLCSEFQLLVCIYVW